MGAQKGLRQGRTALLLAKGFINVPSPRLFSAMSPAVTRLLRLSPVVTDIPKLAPPTGSTLWVLPLAETVIYFTPLLLE